MSAWARGLLLGVVGLVACAHRPDFLAGMIAVDPATPEAVELVLTEGERVRLEGEVAGELKQVPGAQVRVLGDMKGKTGRRRIEVEGYQIVDAGQGVIPHVGLLRWDAGRLMLIQGPELPIIELTGDKAIDLRAQVGARVWVVGPIRAQEKLEVLHFGVLKPAR